MMGRRRKGMKRNAHRKLRVDRTFLMVIALLSLLAGCSCNNSTNHDSTVNRQPSLDISSCLVNAGQGVSYSCSAIVYDPDTPIQTLNCSKGINDDCGGALSGASNCTYAFTPLPSLFSCNMCMIVSDNGAPPGYSSEACKSITINHNPSSFKALISGIPDSPLGNITPSNPPDGSVPLVAHPGLSIEFKDSQNVEMISGAVTVAGSSVTAEVSVRNNTGAAIPRAWLVVHSPSDAVSLDTQSAGGYLDDGVYYYLGTLPDGATKIANISFDLPPGAISGFSAFLELVEAHDRVVFESSQPSLAPEIFSITPQGTDFTRLTYTNNTIYPSNPRWSPDGGWVAYSAGNGLDDQVYLARADGGGTQEVSCLSAGFVLSGAFSRDGSGIYTRHYDPVIDDASIDLLNIAAGRKDCADPAILTTLATGSPIMPILSPDGDLLLYFRRESITIPPPYVQGTPNPTTCMDWPFGSELSLQSINLYLLPLDTAGLPTGGGEKLYWKNTLLGDGNAAFSPDGAKIAFNAGGCADYQYYCDTTNTWKIKCNLTLASGIYLIDSPSDLSDPRLPYTYATDPGTGEYRMLAGTGIYDYDLSWSVEYNILIFSNLANMRIQLWYLDPADPANTRTQLTDWDNFNYTGRFMPPP